jgi:hypothetical protein
MEAFLDGYESDDGIVQGTRSETQPDTSLVGDLLALHRDVGGTNTRAADHDGD